MWCRIWLRFAWGQRPSQWRTWCNIGCNASPDKLIYSTGSTAWSNGQSLGQTIYSTVTAHIHFFAFTVYHFVRHEGWTMNTRQLSSLCRLICMRTFSSIGGYYHKNVFNYYFVLFKRWFLFMPIILLDYFSCGLFYAVVCDLYRSVHYLYIS